MYFCRVMVFHVYRVFEVHASKQTDIHCTLTSE